MGSRIQGHLSDRELKEMSGESCQYWRERAPGKGSGMGNSSLPKTAAGNGKGPPPFHP